MLDAGFSSLATFITGLTAAHYFATAVLGAYALAATAAAVAISIPAALVYASVERDNSILLDGRYRLGVLHRSVLTGLGLSIPAGILAAVLFMAVVPGTVHYSDRWELGLTVGLFTALSPVQDHARRTLHQARVSFGAAAASAVQLCTVLIVIGGFVAMHAADQAVMPLLALSIANAFSLVFALFVARSRRPRPEMSTPRGAVVSTSLRHTIPVGRWFLVSGLVTFGSAFAVTAIITAFSSTVATGMAEQARLVAQPLTLIITAVTAVISADVLSSVASANIRQLTKLLRFFFLGVLGLTLAWVALAGNSWSWSPLPDILPSAYEQAVPLLLIIVGQAIGYSAPVFMQVGLAAGRNRWFAISSAIVGVVAVSLAVALRQHGEIALAIVYLVAPGGDILAGYLLFRKVAQHPNGGSEGIQAVG